MKEVTRLHRTAMEFAGAAFLAQRQGDFKRADELHREAFEKERQAANEVANRDDLELTRSVLHRSAASLALICKETREAERLIARAVSGDPPGDIADELRDLLEEVLFDRHLELRGAVLQPGEFQLSLAGSVVGFGVAPSEQVLPRVRAVETLMHRTADRCGGHDFRERGGRGQNHDQRMTLHLSVPRAASFAITLRFGTGQQLCLPGMKNFPMVVTEDLLDCLGLLANRDMRALRDKIADEAYFRNFVALARTIAPDGKKIKLVGLTAFNRNRERKVALTTPRDKISAVDTEDQALGTGQRIAVRGTLLEADARNETKGCIRLVSSDGKTHKVSVPRGMVSDIVKPMFGREVAVAGVRKKGEIALEDIDLAESDASEMP